MSDIPAVPASPIPTVHPRPLAVQGPPHDRTDQSSRRVLTDDHPTVRPPPRASSTMAERMNGIAGGRRERERETHQTGRRTSISRRTCPTYRRRSITSASSSPNSRAPVDSTTLKRPQKHRLRDTKPGLTSRSLPNPPNPPLAPQA